MVHHPNAAAATAHARRTSLPEGSMYTTGRSAFAATHGAKQTSRSAPGGTTRCTACACASPTAAVAHAVAKCMAAAVARGGLPRGSNPASGEDRVVEPVV